MQSCFFQLKKLSPPGKGRVSLHLQARRFQRDRSLEDNGLLDKVEDNNEFGRPAYNKLFNFCVKVYNINHGQPLSLSLIYTIDLSRIPKGTLRKFNTPFLNFDYERINIPSLMYATQLITQFYFNTFFMPPFISIQ
ncbi:unnamed protein product [Mucor hiemalis]